MEDKWREMRFGDCADLVRDACQPNESFGKPYIGLEHIEQGTLRLNSTGIAEDVTSTKSDFKKGDILFGKLRPYFRKVVRPMFEGICSTDIWVVRAKDGFDQGFLFYWMASKEFVDIANQGSEGTKMPRAKWDFVIKIKQTVPPLPEQKAIASILGALDDKIELNRKMNETLEAMARALFKSWCVDFLPVRAKESARTQTGDPILSKEISELFPDELEDSLLGKIPKGWRVGSLDEIATYLNGLALQKYPPENDYEFLPVIKIAQLRKDNTEGSDKASINIAPAYVVSDGDILFSWSGSLEVVIWCGGCGALNQHLFKVTSKNYPKWFYYLWTKHHLPDFQTIAAGKATTMGHIQRHHLATAKVLVPPPNLLKAMDTIMSPVIENKIVNSVQSRTLASIRDTLLPKLLLGEIRVKDAERFVEEALEN